MKYEKVKFSISHSYAGMLKGEQQFSIQLYCLVFQGDGHIFFSWLFLLFPCAFCMKEEYLHKCVSMVFFFCCFIFEAAALSMLWSSGSCCVTSESRALPGIVSVVLHIGGVCVTF